MTAPGLVEQWDDLVRRRAAMAESLGIYRAILQAWEAWSPSGLEPLRWSPDASRDCWKAGTPLLAERGDVVPRAAVEDLLGDVMEALAAAAAGWGVALQRLARAWDRGEVGPADLVPRRGRLVSPSAEAASGLTGDSLGFLAIAALRPALQRLFEECRSHLDSGDWRLGVCAFCGAPPGFVDLTEGGRRQLACHLCGGAWSFPRVQCPFCGADESRDLVRLAAEGRDEGYAIAACRRCRGYVKELDRRARWDGVSALVEDWGSPHLDVVATRQGYWRPAPPLLLLLRTA